MKRLFGCTVSMIYEDEHGEQFISSLIAERGEFWWSKPDELSLWNSKIELGEKFFNEIINHPVPIDMNTLTALKRCALGLDLYLWLTYRIFALRDPLRLSWRQVYRQFGLHPDKAQRQAHRPRLPTQGSARAKEDQAGLAVSELHHGSGCVDPPSLDPLHTTR